MHKSQSIFEAARLILEGSKKSDIVWAHDMAEKIDKIAKEFKLNDLYIDVPEMMMDLGNASEKSYIESLLVDKVSEYKREDFYKKLCDKVNKAFGSKIL
jgi:hypothetical protein